MVVGNAKEGESFAFRVEQRVAGRIVAVARLAGRADDGEPLVVLRDGDRRPGTGRNGMGLPLAPV